MHPISRIKQLWSQSGLHARLLLPILLIILTAGSLRTYFLVVSERTDALSHYQEELQELQRYLKPVLVEQSVIGDYAAIKQILKVQAKERANVETLQWHYLGNTLSVQDEALMKLEAPAWFVRFAAIPLIETSSAVSLGGVEYGTLKLVTTPVPALNKTWGRFSEQVKGVVIIIFVIFAMINLILRGNCRSCVNCPSQLTASNVVTAVYVWLYVAHPKFAPLQLHSTICLKRWLCC